MVNTGYTFTWECGSASSNMIKVFEENRINWEHSHLGTLRADIYDIGLFLKVDYQHISGNLFEITAEA